MGRTARHPGRGARCLDRVSRRGASPDEDPGIVRWGKSSRPRKDVALSSLLGECDTLAGSYLYMMINRFPESSALRASTSGLKSGDPSGASPLRDRQSVWHPDRGAFFSVVMLKCVTLSISYRSALPGDLLWGIGQGHRGRAFWRTARGALHRVSVACPFGAFLIPILGASNIGIRDFFYRY